MSILVMPAMAADSAAENIIYYEDGSYAAVTLSGGDSARSIAAKNKVYTYYNSLGQKCFSYTLTATFTYNGITSRADSVDYVVGIHRQGWSLSSHSEYVSGNTAYGRAVFQDPDGRTRSVGLTLSCDKNGTVT